jgi:exopolysaccharide biosynthesis polyprenyl glycosylphosphotransferase
MLKQNSRLVDAGLRLLDLLVLTLALPAAYFGRDLLLGAASRPFSTDRHLPLLATTLLLWMVASWMFDLYDVYRTRPVATELSRLARTVLVVALAIAAGGFLGKQHDFSRLVVVLHFGIAFALLAGNRAALRQLARALRRRGYNARLFAVVGSGDRAVEVVESMAGHPEWGYSFAGYILEDGAEPPVGDAPVLGRLGQLGELLEKQVLDEVIFAVPRSSLDGIEGATALCEERGVTVKICLTFFESRIGKMSLTEIDGLPALAFSTAPSDELALAAKRGFDVLASAAALVLLTPLFLLVAVAIKLDSPGPVFFRQRRVGLNGRAFTFHKFRSMRLDAEAQLAALRAQNEVGGPVFKMRNDPRVTRVGRFIRRTSLDELPQFWNVLRGEMSIVGPRPPLPAEVRQYARWQRRRLSVKPGITCTWQVSGRSGIDFEQWMELDLDYIDNWSLWRDVEIVFKTIPAVLRTRGAH